MLNTALFKDIVREIKNSFGRFMSIFAITLLGCGFFAGIKATMPDMKDTAADYFEQNKLMDLKLVSTIGIRSDEIAALKKLDCVDGVMAGYSKDVFFENDGKNEVLKFMSYNGSLPDDDKNNLNHLVLLEGRLPENSGECVVDTKLRSEAYQIGKTIDITLPSDSEELSDTFRSGSFKIVGVVTSPLYIGYERDRTNIGSGTVAGYVYINEADFTADHYSELFLTLKNCDDPPFSDEYLDKVEKLEKTVDQAFSDSVNERFNQLVNESRNKIDSAAASVQSLEEILGYEPEELAKVYEESSAAYSQMEAELAEDSSYLAQGSLANAKNRLDMLGAVLAARQSGDSESISAFEEQLAQSKQEIEAAQQQLDAMETPQVFSYTRYSNSDYGSFDGDSQKIDMISRVFPVFFILVAALVRLTTMTRMIEEQRIQIGTYKALGYSSMKIAAKYLCYGVTASVLGSLIGTAAGLQIFPRIIYNCYKILYNIPEINTPFKPLYAAGCMTVSVICTVFAVVYSCRKELVSQPSELMRPKAPKIGKRVFLEKVGSIWNRLDFLAKVTVRNLMRYKKRFFMTVVGIAGCTALILTGFALKHSISAILDLQFKTVFKYGGIAALDVDKFTSEDGVETVMNTPGVTSAMPGCQLNGEVTIGKEYQSVNVVVPGSGESLSDYVVLRDRQSGKAITLDNSGVVITEKLSRLSGLGVGDSITVDLDETGSFKAEISGVTENYALHYVYITPELYEKLLEKPQFNICYFNFDSETDSSELSQDLLETGKVRGVSLLKDNGKNFSDSLNSLNAIVWLLIICAGALALVVLYNLANINITERVREIATIKVLGFYDGETSAYIYRENIISAVIGIIIGWAVGIVLHRFVVMTAEVDIVMFDRSVVWWSFLFSALLTMAFTSIINIVLHFKLKGISMVESLKSVE